MFRQRIPVNYNVANIDGNFDAASVGALVEERFNIICVCLPFSFLFLGDLDDIYEWLY